MKSNLIGVEAFSGAGGLALGLIQSGFKVPYAFDLDPYAVDTYNRNVNDNCEKKDATELTGKDILSKIAPHKELDLFSGGPPCQGLSKQRRGAHLLSDKRNELIIEYSRLVNEIEPRSFILENISMLGQKRGKQFLQSANELLKDYNLTSHFYNCADYGLAQTRKRYIIVGIRNDISTVFRIPEPITTKWKTIKDVIGNMPEPPDDYSDHPDFPNHQRAKVTKINIERFSHVPQGGGWQDIPHDLRLKCHQRVNAKAGGWPDVYGRLIWNSQCPTITGGFDSFTRGRYGHPKYNRPLTPREAARIQGFPDTFIFMGTRFDIRRQIGNAVPPPLATAIGNSIHKTLLETK